MAIIKQLDKRSGITYVYDSKSYRDPETKKVRSKRTLIGKLDPETGDIIPTDGRGKNAVLIMFLNLANIRCQVQLRNLRLKY